MNAFGDATMVLALFVLFWQTGRSTSRAAFAGADEMSQTARQPRRARPARRRGRQVGAAAAPHLAPGRDGGPDAGLRADPRGDDGHRRRLPDRARAPDLRARPVVADLAAGLGALTLLVAGLVALVQTDIKRVIAYSTMSQIGYMFLGAGLGAYGSGMFHLMTHAFFKALLFLAAGIVIHHLANEQDIRLMGGAAALAPEDVPRLPRRLARARRDPAALRVLLEGRDPRLRAGERRLRAAALRGRPRRRAPDRDLRLPPPLHRLPRPAVAARAGARARPRTRRGAVDDDVARRHSHRARDRRRLDPGRRALAPVRRVARPGRGGA